jgi:hypothetical protein
MDIDDKSPIVSVLYAGPSAVGMEPLDQVSRDVEQGVARFPSFDLASKHGDQVRSQGDDVVPAVLRDGGGQTDDRDRHVEFQVGDLELSDFADPQAGSSQEGVEVGPALP